MEYDILAYDKLFNGFVCSDLNFKSYKEAKEYSFVLFSLEMPTPDTFKIKWK